MQMSLEHLGYVVAIAHDGAVALELARVFQPDAAVIDLRLPVIDGWEVARRLQQKHAGLPIVAMTGMEGDEYRERSARAGFVEHFFKPVDLASLHRCLTAIPSLTRFVAR
jgi:CheY-like chemotaxis protein